MRRLNFKELQAYPTNIHNFDCNISEMVNGIYVGPQGDLLENIDRFNVQYNTDISITKQFTLKPGGYDKIKNAYADWTLRWDMRPRGIESIFNRIRDWGWRANNFKDDILRIERSMLNLRATGIRWQDNTDDLIVELNKIKAIIINALETCKKLYPNVDIDVKLISTKRDIVRDRRSSGATRDYFPVIHPTSDPDEYVLAFFIYIKDPDMTIHVMAPSGEIEQYILPIDDIIVVSGTYLLPLISRNWGRNELREDIASNRNYSFFLECMYLSAMSQNSHPYIRGAVDKYSWDLDGEHTSSMTNICTGNMNSEIRSTLLNCQIEAHISQLVMWLTNYYIPQTNPLNNVRMLRRWGRNVTFSGWASDNDVFTPAAFYWGDCVFPKRIHEVMHRYSCAERLGDYHRPTATIAVNSDEYTERKGQYLQHIEPADFPCSTCLLRAECKLVANFGLLFQEELTCMEEGYIGYFIEIAEFRSRRDNKRIPYFAEEVVEWADYTKPAEWYDLLIMANTCVKRWTEDTVSDLTERTMRMQWDSSTFIARLDLLMNLTELNLIGLYKIAIDPESTFVWDRENIIHFRLIGKKRTESDLQHEEEARREVFAVPDDLPDGDEQSAITLERVAHAEENLSSEERALRWAIHNGGATNL